MTHQRLVDSLRVVTGYSKMIGKDKLDDIIALQEYNDGANSNNSDSSCRKNSGNVQY